MEEPPIRRNVWSEVLSIGGMVGRSVKTKLAKMAVLFKDLFIGGIAGGTAKKMEESLEVLYVF